MPGWKVSWKKSVLGLAALGLATFGGVKAFNYDASNGYEGSLIQRAREESEVVGGVSFPFDKHVVTTGYTGKNAEVTFYGCLVRDRDEVRKRITEGIQAENTIGQVYKELEKEGLLTQYVLKAPFAKQELWRTATNLSEGGDNPRFHLSEDAITQLRQGVEWRQYDADRPMEVFVLTDDALAFKGRYDFDQVSASSDGSVRVPISDRRMPEIPDHGSEALRRTFNGELIEIYDGQLERFRAGASSTVNNGLERLKGTVDLGNNAFEEAFLSGASAELEKTEADRAAKLKRAEELLGK